ncbi:MAG: hypothetical protein M1817_004684 [Caeruleum heppii]|nr:MAG: hypothetical protein M1817_004684 [Caeruleum heppii]
MAPPPSSSLPLTTRLMEIAKTLQFAWFVGHLTLLFCSFRYCLSYLTFNYYSKWAQFSYRTAFLAAAGTYGIVVFKAYRARLKAGQRQQNALMPLLTDENVQYLVMALVWLFSRQIGLAILPFTIYSIFHVATYTRTNLIPTFQAPPAGDAQGASPNRAAAKSPLADTIGRFVKEYYDTSMGAVALLEVLLWFRLLASAFTFAKSSWILLVVYTVFLRARYAQSSFVQNSVRQLTQRIDALVANQGTPPAARQAWGSVKNLVGQAADATDISRYMGPAPGQAPKKAQ